MPAESVLAAHSALAEMSAHPVSKSSFEERLPDPTSPQKRPWMEPGAARSTKTRAAMSVERQSRRFGRHPPALKAK